MANPFLFKEEVDTTYIDSPTTFTTWTDQGDNSHDLSAGAANEPVFDYGDADSEYRPHLTFDGTDDYCKVANHADFNFGANTDFTLEVVFRTTSTSAGKLVDKGDSSGPRYQLVTAANGKLVGKVDDGGNDASPQTSGTVNDGEWQHGFCTFDRDGDGQTYFAGAANGGGVDISGVGDIDDVGEPFTIGIESETETNIPFNGDIALVRIWNRCLSASEVSALSDASDPLNYGDVPAADQWGAMTELLSNGTFEAGGTGGDFDGGAEVDDGATDIFTGWTNDEAGTGKIEATATKHGGNYACKITTGDNSSIRVYQNEADANNAGKKMRLSFWTRGDGTYSGRYRIYDVTNGANIVSTTDTGVTGATYTLVTKEFDVPATCESVRVYLNGSVTATAVVYFDDASLVQIGCVAEWKLGHENAYSPFDFTKARFIPVHEPIRPRQIVGVAGSGQVKVADLGDAEELFPIRVQRVSETVKNNLEGFLADATVNYAQYAFTYANESGTETAVRYLGMNASPVDVDNPLVSGGLYNISVQLRKEIS